jgi:hypothetical protein
MSIRTWIRDWLWSREDAKVSRTEVVDRTSDSTTQIGINNAINGRVLTLRSYQPNKTSLHSDWVTEYYVIKEGESLTEALTMLLMMKGIDK